MSTKPQRKNSFLYNVYGNNKNNLSNRALQCILSLELLFRAAIFHLSLHIKPNFIIPCSVHNSTAGSFLSGLDCAPLYTPSSVVVGWTACSRWWSPVHWIQRKWIPLGATSSRTTIGSGSGTHALSIMHRKRAEDGGEQYQATAMPLGIARILLLGRTDTLTYPAEYHTWTCGDRIQ